MLDFGNPRARDLPAPPRFCISRGRTAADVETDSLEDLTALSLRLLRESGDAETPGGLAVADAYCRSARHGVTEVSLRVPHKPTDDDPPRTGS